jgi:hypothetical protein
MRLKKKISQIVILSVFMLCFFPGFSTAALFTIDIDGLPEPDSGIQSFSIWLSVDSDFAFTDFVYGDAVPQGEAGQVIGWDQQADIATDPTRGLVFKVGGLDQDGAFLSNSFNLTNGDIVTFDYSGTILGVTDIFQFSDPAGDNQVAALGLQYDFTDSALQISNVPIPPGILLLGSGLLGLIGIRRRVSV